MPAFDAAYAQQMFQQTFQQRAPKRIRSPQRNDFTAATQTSPPASSALDPSSPLGQALAACDKDPAVQEVFALPGLKGDLTLDSCYKGRAHFVCVSTALISEARSLTKFYVRIVEAKYPDLNSIESICGLNPDALGSDINGSQEFLKRFAMLKSQYEIAFRCTSSVGQSFKELALMDMTKPADLQKSMADAIDNDFTEVSEVQNQSAALATQMEPSKKALITLDKLHRAVCVNQRTAEQSGN